MSREGFDDLTDVYEATIDWGRRLANEADFYRWLVGRTGARSVLDAACGTGHHADMLHSWGLKVEGADLSGEMIRRCRERYGESDSLRWTVRGFDQPVEPAGSFDLAICVGNSLALAPDRVTAMPAVGRMLGAVCSGGAVLVHVLNLWRLPEGPCVWQKCVRADLPQGPSLIHKGVHRCLLGGFVDLIVTPLDAQPPAARSESVPFLGFETSELERAARGQGARRVEFYGDYQRGPYVREQSQDLIMVAIRA